MRRVAAVLLVVLLTAGSLLVSAGAGAARPAASPTLAAPHAVLHRATSSPNAAASHGGYPYTLKGAAHGRTILSGAQARLPHPEPPRPTIPSYYGHYYAGTYYTGTSFTSHQLSATIQVPLDVAQPSDFYYVILSLWDNASSYDQIGFTNDNGVFGIAYSTTSPCAGYYYYSPNAYVLTPGVTYNFSMSIDKGVVDFVVSYTNGTPVWTLTQTTGGSFFVESAFYTCYYSYYYPNITAYDYTDYEEVYTTLGNLPPYDFFFGANLADDSPVNGFSVFTTYLPGPVTVPINGANAVVANEPFNLYLNQLNSTYSLESPSKVQTFKLDLGVENVNASGTVNLGVYQEPSGWSTTLNKSTGAPPFTYSAQVSIPSGAPIGNYSVGFNGTDSSGNPNQVSVWFNVVPPLTVAVHVAPRGVADLGQNVTLSAVPGGGLGGLSYTWSGLPPGCAGATQTLHCAPTATGTFLISVTAMDNVGDTGSSSVVSLSVNPDPSATLEASPSRVDVNQTVEFYASGISGSGSFTFSWPDLLTGCKAVASIATCVFRTAGQYTMYAIATDAAAFPATTANVTAVVLASPQISLTLSTYTVDVHQPVVLDANATGGAGGYTYTWSGLPSGCSSTAPTATCAFGAAGNFLVTVTAYDSYEVATPIARAYVTVSTDPIVLLVPTTPSVDLGQAAKFDVRVTGGAPGYSYAYLHLPAGCASADVAQLTCSPSAVATYSNLSVAVTDRNSWTIDAAINFTVYSDPSLRLSATPNPVTLGNSIDLVAAVTGGAPGGAFAWQDLPGGCQATPSATISCSPSGTGSTMVNVSVTDGDGYVVTASTVVSVVAPPSVLAGSSGLYVVGLVVVAVAAIVGLALWSRRRNRPPPEE
jgi:hypothetical protein